MGKRHQVYAFAKGHLGQHEDWWHLIENDDGSYSIEHEWDHVSTNGGGSNVGERIYSLEEGLQRAPRSAVEKIEVILAAKGDT
jgi:hypothetical protein